MERDTLWLPARSGGEYAEKDGHVALVKSVRVDGELVYRVALKALDGEGAWENSPRRYPTEDEAKDAAERVALQLQHRRAATLEFSYCAGDDCGELVREYEGLCHPHAVAAAGEMGGRETLR